MLKCYLTSRISSSEALPIPFKTIFAPNLDYTRMLVYKLDTIVSSFDPTKRKLIEKLISVSKKEEHATL